MTIPGVVAVLIGVVVAFVMYWLMTWSRNRLNGRRRFMTCDMGHVTLSRLPKNSQCDSPEGCRAVMHELTPLLFGFLPLSQRVINLQTQLYKLHIQSVQLGSQVAPYRGMVEAQNDLTIFIRENYPGVLSEDNKYVSIEHVAIALLKRELAPSGQRVV